MERPSPCLSVAVMTHFCSRDKSEQVRSIEHLCTSTKPRPKMRQLLSRGRPPSAHAGVGFFVRVLPIIPSRVTESCVHPLRDRLFEAGNTHIEVKCWSCGHSVTLMPQDVPPGIKDYDFEKTGHLSPAAPVGPMLPNFLRNPLTM